MTTTNDLIKPFLKWAGGKRQLLPEIRKYIPEKFNTYYEVFIGGGALLFDLQPDNVVINDYNQELMNAYKVIQEDVDSLIELLTIHDKNNSKEYFYEIRAWDRDDSFSDRTNVERAARILYMNKVNFNGLYRVNAKGQYNVPYGAYKNPNIINEQSLRLISDYLNCIDITFLTGDFVDAVTNAQLGDFVYFDPPYVPLSSTAAFTSYTNNGFNLDDQIRLRRLCDELDARGVKWLLSNSNVEFIQEQYSNYKIEIVNAKRAINSKASGRGKVEEVLIRNY